MPRRSSCDTKVAALRGMSAVTGGSSRFWSWNIISMFCIASPERWRDRNHWSRDVKPGQWPPSFDRIWQALMERHGKQNGTREMIELLKLAAKHGQARLREAIESALASHCHDAAAVRHLLDADQLRHPRCEAVDVGALERYCRPLPVMNEYDQLLAGAAR